MSKLTALDALQKHFADRKDVRVYHAAGQRVAVTVKVLRRLVYVVFDVHFGGTSNDPYSVEGIRDTYCISLREVVAEVDKAVNDAVDFVEKTFSMPKRFYLDHPTAEERDLIAEALNR